MNGRLTQRKSATLTRWKPQVQILYRPFLPTKEFVRDRSSRENVPRVRRGEERQDWLSFYDVIHLPSEDEDMAASLDSGFTLSPVEFFLWASQEAPWGRAFPRRRGMASSGIESAALSGPD